MGKMISVIIPVYNREGVLEECVQSVLAQSYENYEILLIDDGSTDRTMELCRHLAQKDSRIRVLAAEHGGVSAARNLGLEQAAGEYVFFLDSDDVIYPLLLETLVEAMENYGAQIGGTGVITVSTKYWHRAQEKIQEDPVPGETEFLTAEQTLTAMLRGGSPLACIGGVMIRRDLIGDTRFCRDMHIGEDYYFLYEVVLKGAPGIFLKEKWYYVRLFDRNASKDYSFAGFWSRFYRRKLVWEHEEACGRMEFVRIQKKDAIGCFLKCVIRNRPYSEDSKKMRAVLREHKAVLFPALGRKEKLSVLLALHVPCLYPYIHKSYTRLKKR